MIRKLQIKFVAINMAMVTIILCVMFGLIYHFTRSNLETESIGMMRSVATVPFRPGRPNEQSIHPKLPYFTLQIGKRGELISAAGGFYDLSDEKLLDDLIEKSLYSQDETGIIQEHGLRFCRVTTPMGASLVFADMSSEKATLANLVKVCASVGIASFLVFLVISVFLSRRAVAPVAAAWIQQKQFVADASHELKTPLTVIMTNAELLQNGACPEEDQKNLSQGIWIMSRQMKSLVENMLELAKSDAEQTKQQMKPMDLSRLVLDTAISFEGVFTDKGLSLDSEIEPGICVWGDAQALQQVMDILLDNAQKYSSPGGEACVRLHRISDSRCQLRVSNPGSEIPAEELQKIFRRFYRVDKARSRDGGFGLGLSIAESIILQHKGKIWAESCGGINTFVVQLHTK